jgi:hypothetical protein
MSDPGQDETAALQAFSEFAKSSTAAIAEHIAVLPHQRRVSALFNFVVALRLAIQRNPDTGPLAEILALSMDRADRIKDQKSYEDAFQVVADYWNARRH